MIITQGYGGGLNYIVILTVEAGWAIVKWFIVLGLLEESTGALVLITK